MKRKARKVQGRKKAAQKERQLVVKRKGHIEHYDEKKVYASVYAAALNCHYTEKQSEKVALRLMKKINAWVEGRTVVHSNEIKEHIISLLDDKDVALMYKHHLDIC